jgi:hypothetical protein
MTSDPPDPEEDDDEDEEIGPATGSPMETMTHPNHPPR